VRVRVRVGAKRATARARASTFGEPDHPHHQSRPVNP
jgi:hypothetical protein